MLQFVKAQIGGDDQGLAAAVAAVYHVVDLFQSVIRAALHAEIVQNQQRIAAQAGDVRISALKAAGQVIENGGKVRHADGDFFFHQGVGDTGGEKALARSDAAPEQIADIIKEHRIKIVGVKSRVLHLRICAVVLCKAPVSQLRRVKAVLFQLLYGVLMLALLVSQPLFIHAFLLTGAVRGMPVTSEQGGMTIFKIGFLRRMALAAVQQAVLAGIIALVGADFHRFGNNIGKIVHRLSPSLQV